MKITFKTLIEKRQEIIIRYGNKEKVETKGEYGIEKWIKIASKALEKIQDKYRIDFQDGKLDIEIDTALEVEITKDGKTFKQLVLDEKGGYTYSKEGEKEKVKRLTILAKKLNDECEAEEIEFEPYLVEAETIGETDEDFIKENKNIFIR